MYMIMYIIIYRIVHSYEYDVVQVGQNKYSPFLLRDHLSMVLYVSCLNFQ